jgi:hypothetical protein
MGSNKHEDDPTTDKLRSSGRYQYAKSRRSRLLSHSLVVLSTSLLWMLVLYGISSPPTDRMATSEPEARHNITTNAKLITCGNSTQEARQAGCQYDILMNSWVPAPCIDEEFVQDYKDDGSWAAFSDEEMTQHFTDVDELSHREFYYTSVRDHINQCAVMWKKQYAVLFDSYKAFDTIVASPVHTNSCAEFLMIKGERNMTEATKVFKGYAGCWIREYG